MEKYKDEWFISAKCSQCGKEFLRTVHWAYKTGYKKGWKVNYFCGYSCMQQWKRDTDYKYKNVVGIEFKESV